MTEHVEQGPKLTDYIDIFWRRRWEFLLPAALVFIAVATAAFMLPAKYRSQATILIEQPEISRDLVKSTVTGYADQRVQAMSKRVFSTSTLSRIIAKYDLYPEARERLPMVEVADDMRQDITLEMIGADVEDPDVASKSRATIAFTVSFEYGSAAETRDVVDELASLFVERNTAARQATARETTEFFDAEAAQLIEQIGRLESELAAFKDEHNDSLPEMQDLNLRRLQSIEDQLGSNEERLRALDERIIYLQSELAQIQPYGNLVSETGAQVLSVPDRLKALQAAYVSIASRYNETHPDRIKIERELEALRRETGASSTSDLQLTLTRLKSDLAVLRERYSDDHPDVKRKQGAIEQTQQQLAREGRSSRLTAPPARPDNPAYIQIQAQLQAAESGKRSLLERRAKLEGDVSDYESRMRDAPRIERDYLQLTRDYERALTKLQSIEAKQADAQLAESMELDNRAERFLVVDPPLLPIKPFKPRRKLIVLLGMVLAVGAGGTFVLLREHIDDAIYSPRDIVQTMGAQPIAVLPYVMTHQEVRARRTWFLLGALAVITAIVVAFVLSRPEQFGKAQDWFSGAGGIAAGSTPEK